LDHTVAGEKEREGLAVSTIDVTKCRAKAITNGNGTVDCDVEITMERDIEISGRLYAIIFPFLVLALAVSRLDLMYVLERNVCCMMLHVVLYFTIHIYMADVVRKDGNGDAGTIARVDLMRQEPLDKVRQ